MSRAADNRFRVSASRECVRVEGNPSRSVRFLADRLFAGLPKLPSTRCLDLLHIAIGAYAADRLVRRGSQISSDGGIRSFDLTVAVRDPDFWSQASIAESVVEILRFLTDDDWRLSFEPAASREAENGYQHPLPLARHSQPDRVALYSGGLDSAAGLANRVLAGANAYALVTVGHQSRLRRAATEQLRGLQNALGIEPLIHATVLTALRGGAAIRLSQQERTQRSRSFLFAACAIAVATAFEIEEIDVFENGVGSINLPVMTGMLVGGLATRGSHPSFLRQMAILASAIAESKIRFTLPFGMMTKAQILMPLREHGLAVWAQDSRSCVHSSWRFAGKSHCGVCPACIERRQAFAVANIEEADCYGTDIFATPPKTDADRDYFRLYRDEASAWLAGDPRPRRRMDAHLRMTGVPNEQHQQIANLQTRHSQEVRAVYGH
jgi:7-cyano-7-deazaguanine synthase in queuosine biosynthesis